MYNTFKKTYPKFAEDLLQANISANQINNFVWLKKIFMLF